VKAELRENSSTGESRLMLRADPKIASAGRAVSTLAMPPAVNDPILTLITHCRQAGLALSLIAKIEGEAQLGASAEAELQLERFSKRIKEAVCFEKSIAKPDIKEIERLERASEALHSWQVYFRSKRPLPPSISNLPEHLRAARQRSAERAAWQLGAFFAIINDFNQTKNREEFQRRQQAIARALVHWVNLKNIGRDQGISSRQLRDWQAAGICKKQKDFQSLRLYLDPQSTGLKSLWGQVLPRSSSLKSRFESSQSTPLGINSDQLFRLAGGLFLGPLPSNRKDSPKAIDLLQTDFLLRKRQNIFEQLISTRVNSHLRADWKTTAGNKRLFQIARAAYFDDAVVSEALEKEDLLVSEMLAAVLRGLIDSNRADPARRGSSENGR